MKNNFMNTELITSLEAFAEAVKTAMEKYFGNEFIVQLQNVNKNNGLVSTGLSVKRYDCNIAPIIYLNGAYEQYQDGRTLESVCREVIRLYEESMINTNFDVSSVKDFAKVRDRLCFKLINAEKNEALLADTPHIRIEDLAVVFYIPITKISDISDRTGTVIVRRSIQNIWNVDTDTLYELARSNTQRLFPGKVESMLNMMLELCPEQMKESLEKTVCNSLYVCTNSSKESGASAILYDGLLQEFANRIGSDFYILPSSIHETLFIPANFAMDNESLKNMVRNVNEKEVAPDEILSDNIYYFNRTTNRMVLV